MASVTKVADSSFRGLYVRRCYRATWPRGLTPTQLLKFSSNRPSVPLGGLDQTREKETGVVVGVWVPATRRPCGMDFWVNSSG